MMRAPRWLVSHRYAKFRCQECGKRRMRSLPMEHSEKVLNGHSPRIKAERSVNPDGSVTTTEHRADVPWSERFEISRFVHQCENCGWTKHGEWFGVFANGYATWSESGGVRQR